MIVQSEDFHQIVALHNKYTQDKKTRTPTVTGFWKYLLVTQSMPSWLVRQLKKQYKQDPNLAFHLDTIEEDFLLTGALTGTLKESTAKLVLKSKYGYEENPTKIEEEAEAVTRQISYRPATQADVDRLQVE